MKKIYIPVLAAVIAMAAPAYAEFVVSAQGAAVFTGYNDVARPGDTGTRLSLSDDLDSPVVFSPRVEAGYEFDAPFFIGGMASLLRIKAEGVLEKDVTYDGKTFTAGSKVTAEYRFDSYRITGRYYFIKNDSFKVGAGLTGKIRSANININDQTQEGGLSNLGAVPLLHFYAQWKATPSLSLLFYGDGAWSPYGRAEDFFVGPTYKINENFSVMGGYRMLEGGSDGDTVYTFSMFHYAVFGVEARY